MIARAGWPAGPSISLIPSTPFARVREQVPNALGGGGRTSAGTRLPSGRADQGLTSSPDVLRRSTASICSTALQCAPRSSSAARSPRTSRAAPPMRERLVGPAAMRSSAAWTIVRPSVRIDLDHAADFVEALGLDLRIEDVGDARHDHAPVCSSRMPSVNSRGRLPCGRRSGSPSGTAGRTSLRARWSRSCTAADRDVAARARTALTCSGLRLLSTRP